jgi:hypothetical protein
MTYRVMLDRGDAILWAAWEFGTSNALRIVDALPANSSGRVDALKVPGFGGDKRQTYARGLASRVRGVVSYQEGRLGRPLRGGGGIIRVEKCD